jgi:hypothetical protein
MKLALLTCVKTVVLEPTGETAFIQGEKYPAAIYKTKIKAVNELRLDHTISDGHVVNCEWFKEHFEITLTEKGGV